MLLIRIIGASFGCLSFQNPTIFSGSVRENLDPNNEYSDEDIWSALEKARIKRFICRSGSGLETPLTDTGDKPSLILRFVLFTHHGYLQVTGFLYTANFCLLCCSPIPALILFAHLTNFSCWGK